MWIWGQMRIRARDHLAEMFIKRISTIHKRAKDELEQIQLRHARIGSQHIGYGLGMSIVRTLADKHGAELVFSSPPAGGTQGLEVRLVFAAGAG